MDFDSSSKFIASLAKFLQSLCNGYVEFDKGVEVIGHIYLNVDSDTGRKIDYVLNEKVCKNDNSVTFISNSFHAQPAEKPKPPKKAAESDKQNDETVDETGQTVPNSTNVGTIGSYRTPSRGQQDSSYSPGSKRPGSPLQRRGNMGRGFMGNSGKHGMPQSPRYQDSGGLGKMGRSDIPPSPKNSAGDDYDGSNVFQSGGEDDDNYSSNFLNPEQNSSQDVDQKPVIDPDISIVKEEYMSGQQSSCAYSGNSQTSGPGRGGKMPGQSAYPVMLHQNPSSNFPSAPSSSHHSDMYAGSSLEGTGDPSGLTRAQQEELEMYYRKGTDQHLTFLRNMREAHAMYPFTGKRDKELFDKALAELLKRMPELTRQLDKVALYLNKNAMTRRHVKLHRQRLSSQFKSPGQSPRGPQFGRQHFPPHMSQQGYPYQQSPGYPGMERRMSSTASEGGDSLLQAPGEESYDYQQLASDDSQGTQHSTSEGMQQHPGFHGAFGDNNGTGTDQVPRDPGDGSGHGGGQPPDGGGGNGQPPGSPPDIKYEVTPMSFMKTDDFELIEIDPDDDDDI
ncbi:uncharacterized protein LOC101860137 isoform X8 [Aplysia californica]|uniref:Uncharacterized protein LOC101860137 isoform X8 n=1 Tax=Aplysia californica TaxID=6500 RepID=A0ABM0JAZ1_APLCA|nr:uncharacterized protein LOC101860137 isoform X8 [Aplysia californica]